MAQTSSITLSAVRSSPTTLQYALKHKSPHARPAYPKKFFPPEAVTKTLAEPWLATTDPLMPPYPYGKEAHFEEMNHGLYGGARIRSGNKISKGRNKGKTLRKWYPNVRVEEMKSEALGKTMRLPVTARAKRTIEKCGGLDQYLLGEKPARIKELGLLGWKLRWLVLKSQAMRSQHLKERKQLGLNTNSTNQHSADTTFEQAWRNKEVRNEILRKMMENWQTLGEKQMKWRKHVVETLRWDGLAEKYAQKETETLRLHAPETLGLEQLEIKEDKPKKELGSRVVAAK